ncbi:MAG TPA: hypothetical protein PK098_09695 [Phycisphaerales bacterium]|nr:hypothetical protein [Phycisphaerales bacterium]
MFFPESEAIVRDHPDLLRIAEQVDKRLASICSPAPLRPRDLACALRANETQVEAVLELLDQSGIVQEEHMVECGHCQNLMPVISFRQAIQDEDPFECTGCACIFSRHTRPIRIYRMTALALSRTKANAKPAALQIIELLGLSAEEEPLSDRAQGVLLAMLDLNAIDSDRRKSTVDIAIEALGRSADPNALKGVMADLSTRHLIQSKTGRGGGCWLTDRGRSRAERLRDADRNSATV